MIKAAWTGSGNSTNKAYPEKQQEFLTQELEPRLEETKTSQLGIELLFLPPYSPNLNRIERLWKFVKKECLYSKYYETFTALKQAIENCLAEVAGKFKERLTSLLTLNFQTFENVSLWPLAVDY